MAEGTAVGIGGMAWFAEAYSMQEDAQKYIACFETLAQLALAMAARDRRTTSHLSLCLPAESDNAPTESGVNKLFTTSWPLSEFLGPLAPWSSSHAVELQVSHVAGAHNQWADDL